MKRSIRNLLLILVALILLVAIFHRSILLAIGNYLVKAEAPQKADVVLVLAGDFTGSRILTGARLVREGYASKALISGPDELFGMYECDYAIPFAVKSGYPESYFLHLENHSHSTEQEAEAARSVLKSMGVHTLLLVTSNFHTHRAGDVYRKHFPDLKTIVVAAPDIYFIQSDWWHDRQSEKTLLFEYMKTVAYWFGL